MTPSVGSPIIEPQDESAIQSNVEFLRTMEDYDGKKKDRGAKQHSKRSSLGSLSGTKNILAGKFGDAFKRFEGNPTGSSARTPSPLKDTENRTLTPIAGSEATDGRSDDGHFASETELSPEMRRELEAQSLADEERRVEAAAAEYKQKLAARAGDLAHAPTPEKYRWCFASLKYTKPGTEFVRGVAQIVLSRSSGLHRDMENFQTKHSPEAARRKSCQSSHIGPVVLVMDHHQNLLPAHLRLWREFGPVVKALAQLADRVPPIKPNPAPKPTHLNNLPTGGRRSPTKQHFSASHAFRASSDQLVGVGLPGRPTLDMSLQEKEDYIQDFSKRFPSLSSIEMVERDIDAEADRKADVR